jgi:hypothetical protein
LSDVELTHDFKLHASFSDPESGVQQARFSLYTGDDITVQYALVGTKTLATGCQNGTEGCTCSMIGNCYRTQVSTGLDSLHPANWSTTHGEHLYLELSVTNTAGTTTGQGIAMEVDSHNPEPGMNMP